VDFSIKKQHQIIHKFSTKYFLKENLIILPSVYCHFQEIMLEMEIVDWVILVIMLVI